MPDAPPLPSPSEMAATYEAVKNWGRWERDKGALALLTSEHRVAAAALVRSGLTVSLAHDLATEATAEIPHPVVHEMRASGATRASVPIAGYEAARDHLATDVHGMGLTHIDALCHMFVEGRMFDGLDAELVTEHGAERNSIMAAADGVIGRGVLLDVPASRGVGYLDPGSYVTVADLEAAEAAQGCTVRTGDMLVVSTGRDARRAAQGGVLDPLSDGLAGLHPECLAWLRDRSIALLGSDGISDRLPAGPIESWPFPIHQVAITGMGLLLVDNLRLDDVLAACADHGRWEFLLTIAPLRLPGGTGSPVNPIAIF
ncbi:MAG TPA: cyclase family protein [Acidimicrobiales bacterium]|nr:cyclase family protein [Acidimicrobiales bacterium]